MANDNQFKIIRLQAGLTQQKIAEKFGISAQMINRYEKHGVIPRVNILQKYAALGHLTIDDLIDYILGISV